MESWLGGSKDGQEQSHLEEWVLLDVQGLSNETDLLTFGG
jgi:hypothetical protein